MINTCVAADPSTYDECHKIAAKFLSQKNGDSQHTLYAMGHAHIDTGIWKLKYITFPLCDRPTQKPRFKVCFAVSTVKLLCHPPINYRDILFLARLSVRLSVCHASVFALYLLKTWWNFKISWHKCQVWWDDVNCLCFTKVGLRSRSKFKV